MNILLNKYKLRIVTALNAYLLISSLVKNIHISINMAMKIINMQMSQRLIVTFITV